MTLRSNVRQNYASIAAHLSDKSHVMQDAAQGADGPVGLGGGVQKGVTLDRGEIEASALGVVKLNAFVHDGTELPGVFKGFPYSVLSPRNDAIPVYATSAGEAHMDTVTTQSNFWHHRSKNLTHDQPFRLDQF